MRIIGGKDYYDSAASFGIDPTIVFVRGGDRLTNEERRKIGVICNPGTCRIHSKQSTESITERGTIGGTYYHIWYHDVVFCGASYRGIELCHSRSSFGSHNEAETVFFWSEEKFTAWLDARDLRATALSYWDKGHVKSNIHKLFAPIEQNDETIVNLAKLRITILRRENPSQPASDWLINPATLRELEFYRIMNANTAFQQIEQWMSGPLGGQAANPIATITDDKIKIAKHGFDKFSFRKEKGA